MSEIRSLSVSTFIFTILIVASAIRADQVIDTAPRSDALHLRSGRIVLNAAGSLHRNAAAIPEGHYVIQVDGPMTPIRRAALADMGATLGQYLPMNSYIVHLPEGFALQEKLRDLDFVRWVGPFDRSWKLDPQIGGAEFTTQQRTDLANQGKVRLMVKLFEGQDLQAAHQSIAALPQVVITDTQLRDEGSLIELEIPFADYPQLADLKSVQFVEEAPEAQLRNSSNSWIVQSYVANNNAVWNRGITGSGQIGGHIDNSLNVSHCSFRDPAGNPVGPTHRKVVFYGGTVAYSQHGTHTAGTFVGDEFPTNGTTTLRGMAYDAKLATYRLSSVTSTNLLSILNSLNGAGSSVYTNSWGNDGTTSYIQWCVDIDKFSYDNEEELILFAVTNLNAAIKTPENAKNCIGVAASQDNPAQNHCSGGFAFTNDGRRKPELMAPGCSTTSSSGSGTVCTSANSTGTSMACPAVSGAGLLVRQYYMNGFYPSGAANAPDAFTPSGALLKATLINSGTDMTGISGFPSNQEGWGRVLLENALFFTGDARKLIVLDDIRNASGLTTSQSNTYDITVNSNSQSLKVTLVWTEKEATLNANPAYINNLNLTVTGPGGTYLGNFFSGGQSATGGSADNLNNVEQVLLNAPPTGDYTITVTAAAVNTAAPQGYALLVTGDVSPNVPSTPPDCDQDQFFDLERDTACFVEVLLEINVSAASKAAVDMNGDTFNDGLDIPGYVDCVVNGVCP